VKLVGVAEYGLPLLAKLTSSLSCEPGGREEV
jgi:hypothetical protein